MHFYKEIYKQKIIMQKNVENFCRHLYAVKYEFFFRNLKVEINYGEKMGTFFIGKFMQKK